MPSSIPPPNEQFFLKRIYARRIKIHHRNWFRFLNPWVALFLIGFALLWINVYGCGISEKYHWERFRGWPMLSSIKVGDCNYDFNEMDFYGWQFTQPYFRRLSLYENLGFGVIFLPSVFLVLKYLQTRWHNRNQFFLSELLILVTAAAILSSFFIHYEMNDRWFPPNTTEAVYQRLHQIPWFLSLPLWWGVVCTALTIAAAMIHGLRLLVPRRKREL
jgi:hypothetical protein